MSHHHHHGKPLKPAPQPASKLPKNRYGAVVGVLDGPLGDADDNHVFINIRIRKGQYAGRYQAAFNVQSTQAGSHSEYHVLDEQISPEQIPPEDFDADASLSYAALGLKQSDFQPIENGKLRTIVHSTVQQSEWISVYGFTYSNGTGIHDIHMNSGEPAGSKFPSRPNQDGALACYYRTQEGDEVRRWIFIKFSSQQLP